MTYPIRTASLPAKGGYVAFVLSNDLTGKRFEDVSYVLTLFLLTLVIRY